MRHVERRRSGTVVEALGMMLVWGAAVGCSGARPQPQPRPQPQAQPQPQPLPPPPQPPPVVVEKPATPPSPCKPLGAGEVSDEETPSLAGASGRVKAGDWLEARGVTKTTFRAWVRSHAPAKLEDFDADNLFDNEDSCQTLKVGDKSEDALLCTLEERTSIMRYTATAFVVRNKHVVPVLEAGFALPAMDWPDMRWLDLQLTFSAGGLEADLHDRAPPGAVLVRSPGACREYFARYLACEKSHQDGAPSKDLCPMQMDRATRAMTVGHYPPTLPPSPMGGDRVVLRGCDESLKKLDELVKQAAANDPFLGEFRADRAFATRACKARGHYAWKGDRFVRSP